MNLFRTRRNDEAAHLPSEGRAPSFEGATGWLNSTPLVADDLRGRSALVNFCTFTCINWIRQLPYVRAWAEKYEDRGLVVVGVHTPEFAVEHDLDNIRRALRAMSVEYPVAVDNDYAIWSAFANRAWPALYFVDAEGQIRHHRLGEGDYERSERVVQQLLQEAGSSGVDDNLVSVDPDGAEAPADWDSLESSENYVGYDRTEHFASPGGADLDEPREYGVPDSLRLNQWALGGNWTMSRETAALNGAEGRIAYRFHARDLHLVMGPAASGASVRFRVLLDGQPPGPAHGADVDEEGNGTVTEPRLHQLIRQPGRVEERTFEISFLDPGVQAYSFTFG